MIDQKTTGFKIAIGNIPTYMDRFDNLITGRREVYIYNKLVGFIDRHAITELKKVYPYISEFGKLNDLPKNYIKKEG